MIRETLVQDPAKCVGCKMRLRGVDYSYGGGATHPCTGIACPVNYFGGFVCCYECDYSLLVFKNYTISNTDDAARLMLNIENHIESNWPN